MSRDKQIKKVSKKRQEYLKFKPFADDLRKAESWCELDGVLNRYQTVKNLSKMGYRKSQDVAEEIFAAIGELINEYLDGRSYRHEFFTKIAELKKKYTESEVAKRREDIEKSPVDCSTPSVTDSKGDTE